MQTVFFSARENGRVEADLHPAAGKEAVVLCHGKVFSKDTWAPQIPALNEAGLDVLAINFRGYGASKGDLAPSGAFSSSLAQDVLGAVEWLRGERGFERVHAVGASMGGFAAALAATLAEPGRELNRLALLSPVGVEHPEAIRAEAVLYAASQDEAMAGMIQRQHAAAPEPKELLLLPGDAHAQHIFRGDQGPALLEKLLAFLTERV